MSYVVTGATGQVGSAIIDYLLSHSVPVRAVIRSESKAVLFTSRNVEVAIADLTDAEALTKAFQGAQAVFAMNPTAYDSPDMYTAAKNVSNALVKAIKAAQVPRVVALSSIGAEKTQGTGNILTAHILEETLNGSAPQVVMIRCASFMENWIKPILSVKSGQCPVLGSFLQRVDRKFSQVATKDIGCVSAQYLLKPADEVSSLVIVELEGPELYSPSDVAQIVSKILGKAIPVAALPEEVMRGILGKMGCSQDTIDKWIEMNRGFDNDTICWTKNENTLHIYGKHTLQEVVETILH